MILFIPLMNLFDIKRNQSIKQFEVGQRNECWNQASISSLKLQITTRRRILGSNDLTKYALRVMTYLPWERAERKSYKERELRDSLTTKVWNSFSTSEIEFTTEQLTKPLVVLVYEEFISLGFQPPGQSPALAPALNLRTLDTKLGILHPRTFSQSNVGSRLTSIFAIRIKKHICIPSK